MCDNLELHQGHEGLQNGNQVEEKATVKQKDWNYFSVWWKMAMHGVFVAHCFLLSANHIIIFYSSLGMTLFFLVPDWFNPMGLCGPIYILAKDLQILGSTF